jgi:glycerophosphoryl diester phosphodiesterase
VIEVWAHRGDSVHAPENTLKAFGKAVQAGAYGVEFDVQLSSDAQPVVIHDETLERTTNGTGRVVDHTWAQLAQLDASAGRPGFAGEPIPRLAEVLALLAPSGLWANIELKNSVVAYPGLEEIVLAAVQEAGMADRVVLSSFSQASVARLADLTDLEVGLLFEPNELIFRPWRRAVALGATALHPPRLRSSAALVRAARDQGLKVRAWVANRPAEVNRLVEAGVDGYFTDSPSTAVILS